MRKAQGTVAAKPFARHTRFRRNAANVNRQLQANQRLEMTGWTPFANSKQSVDTERVNYRGALYTQPFDPTPRLVKKNPPETTAPKPEFANPVLKPAQVREWLRG